MAPRPRGVTVIGWLLVLVGALGLVFHAWQSRVWRGLHGGDAAVLAIEAVALLAGIFVLRGQNWARAVALLWMGFHLILSGMNGWGQVVIHAGFFIWFAIVLSRPAAHAFFRGRAPADHAGRSA